MAKAPIFPMIEEHWTAIEAALVGPFTTQRFRALVELEAPNAWAEMVRRYGPGGRGSGRFYSPANVLYNYLNRKATDGVVIRHGFVDALEGWGAKVVMQWELANSRALPPAEEDIEFAEGKQKWRLHLVRERASGARESLLKQRRIVGLSCDLCERTGKEFKSALRESIFEVHHKTAPIASGALTTSLKDLALLCACCHRAIHRLVATRNRWFTIEQAQREIGGAQSGE